MNKKMKMAIKESFEPPAPIGKETFLNRVQCPSVSCFEFVCSQVSYIRKWIWGLSGLLFIVALIGAGFLKKDMIWHISAFMPLLAVTIVTENGRSETWEMAELELSARFPLKSIVLARLGIIGIANLILICLLIPFALMNSETTVLQTSVYMLCPYLLTTFFGLWFARKIHGREGNYLCVGAAIGISFGQELVYQLLPIFYEESYVIWWVAALVLLGIGTADQCCKMIKQTEELAWNL